MANTKQSYFKGEDHKGRMMTAYQRGPADPDIVGKMFGMKNVQEISKVEFYSLTRGMLGGEQVEPQQTSGEKQKTPSTPATNDQAAGEGEEEESKGVLMYSKPFPLHPLSELKGKELRFYGKHYKLDFSAVGMKLDDMRKALADALEEFWGDNADVKARWAEKAALQDGEIHGEPLEAAPVPEDMTEAAGGADQEDA